MRCVVDYNFDEIPSSETWVRIEKIEYGWSADEKYYIEDNKDRKYVLRIAKGKAYEVKKKEFEIIKKFNGLDFQMSRAIGFGYFNGRKNVYMLLSWVEGSSLEDNIHTLSEKEQYELGIYSGRILKQMHTIPVEAEDIPLEDKISKKLLQLQRYEESSVRVPNDERALEFVKNNIHLICKSAPVYKHGDFHIGNLIYTPDKSIGVIDFNRFECGDRYEEFYKVQSFDVEHSIAFSVGEIQGYFNGDPSMEFWKIQAVYVAHASLYSIKWAEKFGQSDIDGMTRRCLEAFNDYNNFDQIIPKWYLDNKYKYEYRLLR